ncbi:MAG: single-stranded-DNA-specific exonuclease RecJ [Deltaproteobacteria bacterium]|nr:single-stranded-DNA-specific exonuclease RecJ [Deltaproteobacteria bacterium]
MKKEWVLQKPNPELVSFLSRSLKISNILAMLLVNRKIEDIGEAKNFISGTLKDLPNPFLMKDMKKAVDRIIRAIETQESIYIYGDYDVDGVTATSNFLNFFKELGVTVGFHIPHRLREGYGLHTEALKEIHKKGGKVVITADCGISNVKEAIAASELGIDLIITDHHIVPPQLPDAHAVLNPLRKDSDFPDLYLAGVGVAFNLMIALRQSLRERGYFNTRKEPNLRNYLDLVALGTVADMVPLKGSNHILVKEGLKILSTQRRAGVKALIEVSNIQKETIGTYEVAFQLAPRLNAGGRLSTAEIGVKLLTTQDSLTALELAQKLDSENSKRRFLQEETLGQALQMIEKNKLEHTKSFVLSSPLWHPGVIGIVASKLIEKYYRPTCLIAEQEGVGKGSCRSIEGFHLLDALKECSTYFSTFGGHKAAAGFSIPLQNISLFRDHFERVVSQKLTDSDFIPKIKVDMEITLKDIQGGLLEEIEKCAPFGMSCPEPLFISHDFKVQRAHVVGQKHLKLSLEGSDRYHEAIGFHMSDLLQDASKIKGIVYSPSWNEWQGKQSIQLKLKNVLF